MDYDQAKERFRRDARPRAGNVVLERNTFLEERNTGGDPYYAIRFHATDVVTLWPTGAMNFDTGGWDTKSTADRMNWASGVRAFRVGIGRPNGGDGHIFVKTGDDWRSGYDNCVRVDEAAFLSADGRWSGHAETYGEYQARKAEEARERARERRSEQQAKALDVIVGNPRGRWGWYEVRAGHVRVENGVIFSGQHPVAVCYPHPEHGVQANVLTVSQRALKRTRVGLELVERAAASGCKLVFAPHEQVIEETQNRRYA